MLESDTVSKAAGVVGISTRTIYDRMRTDEFKALYCHARADVLRAAVNNMTGRLSEAVDAVADIMNDKDVNPATRLQAAQTILSNEGKYSEWLQTAENSANRASTPVQDRMFYDVFD